MDLKSLDTVSSSDEGAWLTLLHPKTNAPLVDEKTGKEAQIRLAGSDSEIYRSAQRKAQNKRLSLPRGRRNQNLTAEELEAEALDILSLCTLEFQGIILEGEALVCTQQTAKNLYTRFPWIREQVDVFIADRANYLT
jgi:hypothetical protein